MIKVLYLTPVPEHTNAVTTLPGPGFEVNIVDSLEEGIEMTESDGLFDCLVADTGFRAADIAAMIRRIRSIDPTLPVVLCSGGDIPAGYYTEAIKAGADYCLARLEEMPDLIPVLLENLNDKRETARQYWDVSELAPVAIGIHSEEKIVYLNKKALGLFRIKDRSKIHGRNIFDFIHPDYHKVVRRRIMMSYNLGQPADFLHEVIQDSAGNLIDVEIATAPAVYAGKPATIFVARDLTGRIRAENEMKAANLRMSKLVNGLKQDQVVIEKQDGLTDLNETDLKKQNERLDFALRMAGIGIWDIDPASGRSYVNDEWFRLLVLKRDAVPDPVYSWENLVFSEDRESVVEKYGRFTDGRDDLFCADYRVCCGDGKNRWFSDTAFAVDRDESGRPNRIIRVFINIDRFKPDYTYLKETNKKLNMMSSIIRHDALNQVTGMMIFMDMLKELADEDNDLKRYVDQIDKGMNSIHDKLVFTRDYQDLGEYGPRWQNVSDLIREVLPDIEMEGISVGTRTDGLEIYSDPLLRMVFIRLIENTVRHGVKATRIDVSYSISGEGCRIVLEDDGIGIPASEKNQMFRNAYGRHAGYGLFLVRQLLSITGIGIEETGEEGRGARFEILVPKDMYRLNRTKGQEG